MSQRYVSDTVSGTQIVNAYAAKKAAQMERARQLRQERELKKRDQGEAPPAAPLGSARPPSAGFGAGAHMSSPLEQPAEPSSSPVAAAHSHITRTTHHAHQSPVAVDAGMPAFPEVEAPASTTVLVGENDLFKAVQAGIITMDQCRKLWETFQRSGKPVAAEPPQPASHRAQYGAAQYTSAPKQAGTPGTARKHMPPASAVNDTISDPARMSSQVAEAQSRDQSHVRQDDGGWNMDTDMMYQEPETDEEFLRRQGRNFQPRSQPKGRQEARPDWQGGDEDSSGGFGAPPPVRKPARKPAGRAPKGAVQTPSSRDSGSSTHAPPLSLDDMPVGGGGKAKNGFGGGGGGGGGGYGASAYPEETVAQQPARRRPSSRAQPSPQMQAHHMPEDRGGPPNIDSMPTKSGNMEQLQVEAAEAASEPQRQCYQCGRSFRESVLSKHSQICGKQKARKVFNISKQRQAEQDMPMPSSKSAPPPPKPKTNWKQQHEDFISAMKSNKLIAAVERGEAPASALKSIPAPKDNRVPCPHCTRKFAADVAERHIPKCKNILHKPKSLRRY